MTYTLDDFSGRTIYGTVAGAPPTTATVQRMPDWQRTWYEERILDTIRTQSILVPYCNVTQDHTARKTGKITYTEVYDLEPNWNSIAEDNVWFKGGALDSRTLSIELAMYHNIVKFSEYMPVTMYVNNGDMRGLVSEKLGQDVTNTMDILARNAYLTHPNPKYAGTATTRATLGTTDYFEPDYAELVRTELEENDIPGIANSADATGASIVCVTTPRVIHDIRTAAGSEWLEVQLYEKSGRKFSHEVGTWAGVRFVKTNRLRLQNAGTVINQSTTTAAIVPGQGAYATVDTIYSPGQTGSTRYISVTSASGFAVGDYVTIHKLALGTAVLDTDGTQEIRRIVNISSNNIAVDKPFLKDHESGDYITKAQNVHASMFIGGPGVVLAIAERPTIIIPPTIDDAQMINRIGWRGYFKFNLFRPEYYQVLYSSGSDNE